MRESAYESSREQTLKPRVFVANKTGMHSHDDLIGNLEGWAGILGILACECDMTSHRDESNQTRVQQYRGQNVHSQACMHVHMCTAMQTERGLCAGSHWSCDAILCSHQSAHVKHAAVGKLRAESQQKLLSEHVVRCHRLLQARVHRIHNLRGIAIPQSQRRTSDLGWLALPLAV
jgi:hypothetical protein